MAPLYHEASRGWWQEWTDVLTSNEFNHSAAFKYTKCNLCLRGNSSAEALT